MSTPDLRLFWSTLKSGNTSVDRLSAATSLLVSYAHTGDLSNAAECVITAHQVFRDCDEAAFFLHWLRSPPTAQIVSLVREEVPWFAEWFDRLRASPGTAEEGGRETRTVDPDLFDTFADEPQASEIDPEQFVARYSAAVPAKWRERFEAKGIATSLGSHALLAMSHSRAGSALTFNAASFRLAPAWRLRLSEHDLLQHIASGRLVVRSVVLGAEV